MDDFELSKQKKNITRDFSDGLLIAEIVSKYYPHIVEPHNYYNTNSKKKKNNNWDLLKKKVFKKLNYKPEKELIKDIIDCKVFAIEFFLYEFKNVLENAEIKKPVLKKRISSFSDINKIPKTRKKSEIRIHKKNNLREDKDRIKELKNGVEMLELKIKKMEEILSIKNEKIKIMEIKLEEGKSDSEGSYYEDIRSEEEEEEY